MPAAPPAAAPSCPGDSPERKFRSSLKRTWFESLLLASTPSIGGVVRAAPVVVLAGVSGEAPGRRVVVPLRGACGVAALWPVVVVAAVGVAAAPVVVPVPLLGEAREFEEVSLERLERGKK